MLVREDFRRDGLAANFLADSELINLARLVLKGSKINIGYPAICSEEYKLCCNIVNNSNSEAELCVVGHGRKKHLEVMASVIKGKQNVSANSWIPISNYFLEKTLKISPKDAFKGLVNIIETWKKLSDKPFDIAFADCTSNNEDLSLRIKEWSEYCLNNGVRNIIICDTRGIATEKTIKNIFDKLDDFIDIIEVYKTS